jgi:hypothetical protein
MYPGGRRNRLWMATVCAFLLAATSAIFGQQIWVGGGRFNRVPPKWAKLQDFDGSFLYCRGYYTSVVGEAGGSGWSTDYPGADNNFSIRLSELTRVEASGAAHFMRAFHASYPPGRRAGLTGAAALAALTLSTSRSRLA